MDLDTDTFSHTGTDDRRSGTEVAEERKKVVKADCGCYVQKRGIVWTNFGKSSCSECYTSNDEY